MSVLANFAQEAVADLIFQQTIVDLIGEQYGDDEESIYEAIQNIAEGSGLEDYEVIGILEGDYLVNENMLEGIVNSFDVDEDMVDGLIAYAELSNEALLEDEDEYYDEDEDWYDEDEDEYYDDEIEDEYYEDEDEIEDYYEDDSDYAFEEDVSDFAAVAAAEIAELREFKETAEFTSALDAELTDVLNDAEILLSNRQMSPIEYALVYCDADGNPLSSYSTNDRISTFCAAVDQSGETVDLNLHFMRTFNDVISKRGNVFPEGSFLQQADEVINFSQGYEEDYDDVEEDILINTLIH